MNLLINKYKDYIWNEEFPNIDMVLLYESGGDLTTYSSIIGYNKISDLVNDLKDFHQLYKDKYYSND